MPTLVLGETLHYDSVSSFMSVILQATWLLQSDPPALTLAAYSLYGIAHTGICEWTTFERQRHASRDY
jgi:hypothetical protein